MNAKIATVPLGEVVDVIGGGTPSKRNPAFYGGDIPWATVRDMNTDLLNATEHKITKAGLDGSSSKVIPAGEVVIATRVGLGKVCVLAQDTAINQDLRGLIPKAGQSVDQRYLFYWLKSIADVIIGAGTGATVQGVKLPFVKSLPIPLPPLEEQQRIVAVLDEAFEGLARARAHAEANLQNARELFASALQSAFSDEDVEWREAELGALGAIVTGSTPKKSDPDSYGDYVPFIKPGDFHGDGSLEYENEGLSEKGAAASRVISAGSALMVCIGATIGKAGYSEQPLATNQQINAITPEGGLRGEYLYLQMLTPEFQSAVWRGAGQATLPIINKSKWSKLAVRVPVDLHQQEAIVDRLFGLRSRLDEVASRYQATLDDLEDLRHSLLQKAFAGELT